MFVIGDSVVHPKWITLHNRVANCSARARFGFLFGSILSTCPSNVQRLFSSMRVTSLALIAALSSLPMVLFLTLLFREELALAILT